jgi:hypothetical protein
LYDHILERSTKQISVIGNPGIAKTSFSRYLMWRVLFVNQIFIYEYAIGQILLQIKFEWIVTYLSIFVRNFRRTLCRLRIFTVDLITEPVQLNCNFAEVLNAPNPERYSVFAKNNVWKVYVNTPAEDAVMDMCPKLERFRFVSEKTVKEQLRIYGPIPGYIFDKQYHGKDTMNAAIAKNGEKIYEILSSDMQFTIDDNDVSYRLVHLVSHDFRCHNLKVATQYVYDNLSSDMKRKVAARFSTSLN